MSPRAAVRLEHFGFTDVYDYVAGKNDWIAAGLPTEGARAYGPRAGDVLDTGVPTCAPTDTLAAARDAMRDAGRCVVVNEDGVVLGELRRDDAKDGNAPVEQHMREGPTTIRPSEYLHGLVERMRDAKVASVLVTTPEGKLLGLLHRDRAEATLDAWHSRHHAAAGQ